MCAEYVLDDFLVDLNVPELLGLLRVNLINDFENNTIELLARHLENLVERVELLHLLFTITQLHLNLLLTLVSSYR